MWNKYYTPTDVARSMVELIDVQSPKSVIDICVGSWNLLREARDKWDDIKLIGVDIDSGSSISSLPISEFYRMDGRQFALKCLRKQEKFSVVLANPPFGKLSQADIKLFTDLPGYEEMTKRALYRIETTMLLANISLLDEGGSMAAIVPSTVIDGEWANCLRTFIAKFYQVHFIINLPLNIFGCDISTSIIVIKKKNPSHYITTQVINAKAINGKLKYDFLANTNLDQIIKGEWTQPIIIDRKHCDFSIIRGGVTSSKLKKTGVNPVLHSTDIRNIKNGNWSPTRFCEDHRGTEKTAREGDIVMVRVGRNCGLAAFVDLPLELPVSDCVLIFRHTSLEKQKQLWKIVNSSEFKEDIRKLRKGVSTFYLTKSNLSNYLQSKLEQIKEEKQ